jgi:osmotically-inducible protein OsmY
MASFQPHYSSFQPHDSLFTDRALEQRIVAFFAKQNIERAKRFRIGASAGHIVLTGSVESTGQKLLAELCCRRVAGVIAVSNRIRIIKVRPTTEGRWPQQLRYRSSRGWNTTALRV